MNRRRGALATACALGVAVTMAACSTSGGAGGQQAAEASEPSSFSTLTQLAAASTLVVVAEPTGARRTVAADATGASGDRSTLATLRVVTVFKGSLRVGDTLLLRQFGTKSVAAPQGLVVDGSRYLAFLVPFTFEPRTPTGQWTTTSLGGLYAASGAGEYVQVVNGGASTLPGRVTDADVRASVGGG